MKYDKDMHRTEHCEIVSLDPVRRHGADGVPRLPPRTMLLGWALAAIVPWALIAAVVYRW